MLGSLGVKVTCVDVLSDLQMRLEMVLDQRHPRLSKTPQIKPPRFPFSRNFPGGVRNARVFFLQFIAQVWPGSYWRILRILRILGFCHVCIQEDWEKIISHIFDPSKNAKCFEIRLLWATFGSYFQAHQECPPWEELPCEESQWTSSHFLSRPSWPEQTLSRPGNVTKY